MKDDIKGLRYLSSFRLLRVFLISTEFFDSHINGEVAVLRSTVDSICASQGL